MRLKNIKVNKRTLFLWDSLQLGDAANLSALMVANAERFQRFFPKTLDQNSSPEASEAYILRKAKEISSRIKFTYAIREVVSEQVAGLVILKEIAWERKQGELAYCIGSEYNGKGWVTQTIKEVSAHAFENLGLETLQIITHQSNIASVQVAKKCGYRWKNTLLKTYTPPGEAPLDMELYELNKDDVV